MRKYDTAPTRARPRVRSMVAMGRWMKGVERLMGQASGF